MICKLVFSIWIATVLKMEVKRIRVNIYEKRTRLTTSTEYKRKNGSETALYTGHLGAVSEQTGTARGGGKGELTNYNQFNNRYYVCFVCFVCFFVLFLFCFFLLILFQMNKNRETQRKGKCNHSKKIIENSLIFGTVLMNWWG